MFAITKGYDKMDIKTLRNYVEIIESGSITSAAKKLFIAQPALSNQLKALEKELGTKLIDRGPHRQEVTHSGKLFYERAKHIIELENGIKRDITKYENRSLGSLRLGITPYTALTLFDGLIVKFCSLNPDIKYEIYENDSGKLIELIENNVIDVAVIRTPCMIPKNTNTVYLEEESWIAVYSDKFSSFDKYDTLPLDALMDTPISLIRRHEDIFMNACNAIDYMPDIKYVSVQLSTVFEIAKNGLAVGIVPFSSVDYIQKEGFKFKRIKNDMLSVRRAIVTRNDREYPVICGDFVLFCKKELGI